jgi:hypothetical protein
MPRKYIGTTNHSLAKKNLKDIIGNSLRIEAIKIQTNCNNIRKEMGCFQKVFNENLY